MLTFGQASESSPSVAFFFAGCIAITLYNALEIIILVFVTFKRFSGWYFWSLLVASLGLIVATIGFSTYFFKITPHTYLQSAVTIAGWWAFIVGQSLVLWSRLHLVLQSPCILRSVLIMITINAVILLIPTTVLAFCYNIVPVPRAVKLGYEVMEPIQITIFCVQELIISGLYIWGTAKILKYTAEERKQRLMAELIIMNVVLIIMDFVLLGVQYAGFRILQNVLKYFAYSIKLKFELAVLGRLTKFFQDQAVTFTSTVGDPRPIQEHNKQTPLRGRGGETSPLGNGLPGVIDLSFWGLASSLMPVSLPFAIPRFSIYMKEGGALLGRSCSRPTYPIYLAIAWFECIICGDGAHGVSSAEGRVSAGREAITITALSTY
ncbi:Uncharacterized protein HZ326_29851 [Fusarium oxysporum f. sp. albedinis]|nr:Uncharacterized protein HZ326_29851 [Fusarium oxysporum f. sp. albedinis]